MNKKKDATLTGSVPNTPAVAGTLKSNATKLILFRDMPKLIQSMKSSFKPLPDVGEAFLVQCFVKGVIICNEIC